MLLFVMITGVLATPVICHAKEEALIPFYGTEVKDGTYQVEIDSSSSMFRIVKAELTVDNGEMSAIITLSGTGYLKLFMGTREEAANALEEAFIPYVEDAEGAYTYTIPVEVLNKEFDCAAFSKRKESWYDRKLVVLADSLPEDAVISKAEEQREYSSEDTIKENKEVAEEVNKETTEESKEVAEKSNEDATEDNKEDGTIISEVSEENTEAKELKTIQVQADDGTYTMEVTLSGGSGKATITSPTVINVSNQTATARIEWSSPNYDYMLVNGEKYLPLNTEGNSVFEIPVLALDEEMTVVADTVAMSKAHEIEYTLLFHSNTLKSKSRLDKNTLIRYGLYFVAAAGGGFVGVLVYSKRKKKKVQDV